MSTKLKWTRWLYGLGTAAIGGGSGAVISAITSIGLAPDKFNLVDWTGTKKVLIMMCVNFVGSGALSVFFYLKQSPLPECVEEDSNPVAFTKTKE